MKKSYTHNHSGLFLMEIILSILCFIIVSVICLQLFAHARLLSLKAGALNDAVRITTTAAETILACDSVAEAQQAVEKLTEDPDIQLIVTLEDSSALSKWQLQSYWAPHGEDSRELLYEISLEVYYGK